MSFPTLAPQDIIKRLGEFFSPNQILTDESSLKIYGRDWTKYFIPDASAIVLPTTVEQISKFLALVLIQSVTIFVMLIQIA